METTKAQWRESQATRGQIVSSLIAEPQLSRRELVNRLGLGPATVSTQVRRLLDMGVLEEGTSQIVGAGRPRVPLQIVPEAARAIGVGLERHSATIAAVKLDGSVVVERQVEMDASDPEFVAREISITAKDIMAEEPEAPWWGLGTALSGVISPSGRSVRFSVIHDWRNVPLGRMVAANHGSLPVLLANDISALAQRELSRPGVGTPADFLLVSIGAGVGMALVRDRRIVSGERGASTEMGHVSVDPLGPRCRCGNNGCLQALAGLEALGQAVARVAGRHAATVAELTTEAAASPGAAAALDRSGYWLGRAVGGACTMLGLGHVLLTGESLPLWPYLVGGFELGLGETVKTLSATPKIDRRPWDPAATAVGAASLVLNRVLSA